MNTITITLAATPGNLMKLAQAFGDSIDDVIGADDVPATRTASEKTACVIKPAVLEETKPEPVKDPTVPEPAPAPEPEKPSAKVSKTEIRSLALKLTKEGKSGEISEIFKSHGAKTLSEVQEADYAVVLRELEAIA